MDSRDRTALGEILRTIQRVEGFPRSDPMTFAQTDELQDALIRCLQVISAATRRLSLDLCAQNPEIPWPEMAGMHDVLMHPSDQVEAEEAWITFRKQLPHLKEQIEALLEE